jgi:hypothetical protein
MPFGNHARPPPSGSSTSAPEKLSVDKALEKLRGSDEPKSRMTVLDEKNKKRLTKSCGA